MENEEHLKILKKGVDSWNRWRSKNQKIIPILHNANLFGITTDAHAHTRSGKLMKGHVTDLSGINLSGAELWRAFIESADLSNADLTGASLLKANLRRANLSHANLEGADLYEADLYQANLSWANLSNARLTRARLVDANLENANLENCNIYGISAWSLKLNEKTNQRNLVISDPSKTWEPPIRVDDIEVAQFIHLLLNNERIRFVVDTITSKVVLILGRFTPERKTVLDAIRNKLRMRNYVPVLFDFDKPVSRDLVETITLLASIARFIIADITEAKSIPAELERIVPDLPSVPVQPLILRSYYKYELFKHIKRYPWVLKEYQYDNLEELLESLTEKVITPAEAKAKEIREEMTR